MQNIACNPIIGALNRRDRTGLITNIVYAVFAVLLTNGIIFGFGWSDSTGSQREPGFAPSGAVIGSVWTVLFVLMATARWLVISTNGGNAKRDARLVLLLIGFCLIYPFYTLAPGSTIAGLIGNAATILLALYVAWQVRTSSRWAALLILAVVAWVSFASFITTATIQLNS